MNRRQALGSFAGASVLMSLSGTAASESAANVAAPSLSSRKITRAYINGKDGQLHYWTVGHGPNLVLVHQSANSSDEYLALVPLLQDHYRMIAIDLPGHGQSDDPPSEPTVDDYSNAIEHVLDHLKIARTHILGHHGGALATMNLVVRNRNRFDKVILSGTGGIPTKKKREDFIDRLTKSYATVEQDSDLINKTWSRYMRQLSDGGQAQDMVRALKVHLESTLRPYRSILVNLKYDRTQAIKKLTGPVLLVQGGKDEYVSGQESLLDIIPDSSRIVLPRGGTFMFYDRADDCAKAILDYLA